MVKPLIPLMEYYANYDYIAQELCENKDKPLLECNGKCYLVKQIKANKPFHSHESLPPLINMDDYPLSLVTWFNYDVYRHGFIQTIESDVLLLIPQDFSKNLLKPPIV